MGLTADRHYASEFKGQIQSRSRELLAGVFQSSASQSSPSYQNDIILGIILMSGYYSHIYSLRLLSLDVTFFSKPSVNPLCSGKGGVTP